MTFNYKDYNIKTLGHVLIVAIIMLLLVGLFQVIVMPVVYAIFPILGKFTLTDIILFLILVKLAIK